MTIGELVKELEKLNPDSLIHLIGYRGYYQPSHFEFRHIEGQGLFIVVPPPFTDNRPAADSMNILLTNTLPVGSPNSDELKQSLNLPNDSDIPAIEIEAVT